jgi:hypothetical protein
MPMKSFRNKQKSTTMDAVDQKPNATPAETQARQDANFAEIESRLPKRFRRTEMGLIDKGTGMTSSPLKHSTLTLPSSSPGFEESFWQEGDRQGQRRMAFRQHCLPTCQAWKR